MITRVKKWGDCLVLRLSEDLLGAADIEVGDQVDVTARGGTLVVTPVRRLGGRPNLRQLVRAIPADYQPGELDWGRPVGGEAW
jgi:antitoxin component of MazEF toxin-antitoxin module